MFTDFQRRVSGRGPSPAMVVAIIALIVAIGGTSYAAFKLPANSVGTHQIRSNAINARKIKKDAVTAKKIKNGQINSAKVKDHTLLAVDFKDGELPAGATGEAGATGPTGLAGTTGAAGPTGPAGPIEGTPAGGSLAGTYPNPSLTPGAVGPVELSATPAARIISSVVQTTVTNTNTIFNLDETQLDQGGIFNDTDDALDISVPGVYVVTGTVGWKGNSTGQRRARILLNGNQVAVTSEVPGTSGTLEQPVSWIGLLQDGDRIQIGGFQTSGGNLDTSVTTGQGAVSLAAAWVSP